MNIENDALRKTPRFFLFLIIVLASSSLCTFLTISANAMRKRFRVALSSWSQVVKTRSQYFGKRFGIVNTNRCEINWRTQLKAAKQNSWHCLIFLHFRYSYTKADKHSPPEECAFFGTHISIADCFPINMHYKSCARHTKSSQSFPKYGQAWRWVRKYSW